MASIFEEMMTVNKRLTESRKTSTSGTAPKKESRKFSCNKIKVESRKIFEENDVTDLEGQFDIPEEDTTGEDSDGVVLVIDPEAPADEEVPEDAAEEMVGDFVYKCPVCGSNYVCDCDSEGVVEGLEVDEEGAPLECPICGDDADQILVGEITPAEEVTGDPVEPPAEEVEDDEIPEDEDLPDEDLDNPKESFKGRRRVKEATARSVPTPEEVLKSIFPDAEFEEYDDGDHWISNLDCIKSDSDRKIIKALREYGYKEEKNPADGSYQYYYEPSSHGTRGVMFNTTDVDDEDAPYGHDDDDEDCFGMTADGKCAGECFGVGWFDMEEQEESLKEDFDETPKQDPLELDTSQTSNEVEGGQPSVQINNSDVDLYFDEAKLEAHMNKVIRDNYKGGQFTVTAVRRDKSRLKVEYVVRKGKKSLKGLLVGEGFLPRSRTMIVSFKDKGAFTESFGKTPAFIVECVRVKNKIYPTRMRYDYKVKVNESLYRVSGSTSSKKN